MDKNSSDLINLISCFLNNETPEKTNYNWEEIYKLASIHDIAAIVAQKAKLLPIDYQPKGKIKSYFNQSLGLTVRAYYSRCAVKEKLCGFFEKCKSDFIFVKGCEICRYYPQPEFRTSGDIDVIVKADDYERIINIAKEEKFADIKVATNTASFKIDDYEVEIHKGADVYGDYFADIFTMCEKHGYEYKLDEYNALLYVLLHIAKHLKNYGAGLRMLMDVDVCVRAINDFDEKRLIKLCADAKAEKCCKMILSLCNYWFDTPVSRFVNFSDNQSLLDLLVKCFIYGGTFGFYNKDVGSYYLTKSASGKVGFKERLKAVLIFIFPKRSVLINAYSYCAKHSLLIPLAYINRLFDGIFRRGYHSITTFKQIMVSDEKDILDEVQLLKELDI